MYIIQTVNKGGGGGVGVRCAFVYQCGKKHLSFLLLTLWKSDIYTCINMNHMIIEVPLQLMSRGGVGGDLFSGCLHWFGHLCSSSRAKSE